MYRNDNYDRDIAEKMKNPLYAQGFLLDLMENQPDDPGFPLESALRIAIQSMGVVEFCSKIRISKQNINSFLNGKRSPKPETLDQLLKPFGLRTRLVVEKIPVPRKSRRAG